MCLNASIFSRAYAYAKLGGHELAVQDLTEAIRLDPQNGDAYYNRGIAYQHLGMTEESESDFEKAKELGVDAETDE